MIYDKNIFAHTETTPPSGYPAFLSINKIARQEPAVYRLTVRSSNGYHTPQEIDLDAVQIQQLAGAILMHLEKPNDTTN